MEKIQKFSNENHAFVLKALEISGFTLEFREFSPVRRVPG